MNSWKIQKEKICMTWRAMIILKLNKIMAFQEEGSVSQEEVLTLKIWWEEVSLVGEDASRVKEQVKEVKDKEHIHLVLEEGKECDSRCDVKWLIICDGWQWKSMYK